MRQATRGLAPSCFFLIRLEKCVRDEQIFTLAAIDALAQYPHPPPPLLPSRVWRWRQLEAWCCLRPWRDGGGGETQLGGLLGLEGQPRRQEVSEVSPAVMWLSIVSRRRRYRCCCCCCCYCGVFLSGGTRITSTGITSTGPPARSDGPAVRLRSETLFS